MSDGAITAAIFRAGIVSLMEEYARPVQAPDPIPKGYRVSQKTYDTLRRSGFLILNGYHVPFVHLPVLGIQIVVDNSVGDKIEEIK